jgi:eukaryotic-like serine/threonine-protein kinase
LEAGGGQYAGPMAVGGVVYFGGRDQRLYALRAADGASLWSSGAGGGPTGAIPVVTAGMVYFGGFDNRIHALAA